VNSRDFGTAGGFAGRASGFDIKPQMPLSPAVRANEVDGPEA
jgi:hypothetical protein